MTGRCDGCELWREPDGSVGEGDWQFDRLGWRICDGIPFRFDLENSVGRELNGDRREAAEEAALSNAKAVCVDGSDYRAFVFTAPEFGCVNWKAKP